MNTNPAETREHAFCYPNPMWTHGNWIKNLVLFFDGIALLIPDYMKERPEKLDTAILVGLKEQGLVEIIEPERAVDKSVTEKLAMAMTDIITSGVLDELGKEETAFHELSMSRQPFSCARPIRESDTNATIGVLLSKERVNLRTDFGQLCRRDTALRFGFPAAPVEALHLICQNRIRWRAADDDLKGIVFDLRRQRTAEHQTRLAVVRRRT
jgi:hypothetical protein